MDEANRVLISCGHVWDAAAQVIPQLEALGLSVDMPLFEGQQLEESDLLPVIGQYVGVLAGDDHLSRRVLEAARTLKVISKWGIGVDSIDLEAAEKLGIKVFNTPGVFGEELADYAMGFIHMLARHQHEVNNEVKQGRWHKVRGRSLAGMTLGIVGMGSSGRALARRATASSMRVLGYDVVALPNDPSYEPVTLERLWAEADVVSLHLPASSETRHLINERTLGLMRKEVWLINISRGALVDEAALVAALKDGTVGAAAIDVFEDEPVSPDNPLLTFGNVIVGAHNGSNTAEAVARTTALAVANLIHGLGLEGT